MYFYKTFKYMWFANPYGYAGQYYFSLTTFQTSITVRDVDDGNGDNLTQLGDITRDVFMGYNTDTNTDFPHYFYGGDFTFSRTIDFAGHANAGFYARLPYTNEFYIFTDLGPRDGIVSGTHTTTFDSFVDPTTQYSLACYLTGTHIRTDAGDVAVEVLKIGDSVVTAGGAERRIKWIGTRRYGGRYLRNNPEMLPICFRAGSIAEAVPARDLWVSPNHAMYLQGVLIEARHLVNGVTVVRAGAAEEIAYWHIELDSHDVLLAEGAASESFADDSSRGMFDNVEEHRALYPEDVLTPAIYCAQRVDDGHAFAAARAALDARQMVLDGVREAA